MGSGVYKPYYNPLENRAKAAFVQMMQDMPRATTMAVTLTTNSDKIDYLPKTAQGKRDYFDPLLSIWDRKLCREFVGPNFHKSHKYSLRQTGFAFPEEFETNPHYHVITNIQNWPIDQYVNRAEQIWFELWDPSTVEVVPIYDFDWEKYITKKWDISGYNGCIGLPYVFKPSLPAKRN